MSQNSIKIITRKIAPKPKTVTKIKQVVQESDDNNSPPPTELKTKSSVFDRLGVGDVSSTTPNFDSNNTSYTDSRKVCSVYIFNFKMLNIFKKNSLVFCFQTTWNKTEQ